MKPLPRLKIGRPCRELRACRLVQFEHVSGRLAAVVVVVLVVLAPTAGLALAGVSTAPPLYKNCTNLNKKYPHGLGRVGARDHTSGTPVTNFKRSTKLYKLCRTTEVSIATRTGSPARSLLLDEHLLPPE